MQLPALVTDKNRIAKLEVKPVGATAITNNFTYDNYGYLSSTGDWAISNDTLGRIQMATGHWITTLKNHARSVLCDK